MCPDITISSVLIQFPPMEALDPVVNTLSIHMIAPLKLKSVSLSAYTLVNSIAIAFKELTSGLSTELIILLLLVRRLDFLLKHYAANTIVYQALAVLRAVSLQWTIKWTSLTRQCLLSWRWRTGLCVSHLGTQLNHQVPMNYHHMLAEGSTEEALSAHSWQALVTKCGISGSLCISG